MTRLGLLAASARAIAARIQNQGREQFAETILRNLGSPGTGVFEAAAPFNFSEPYALLKYKDSAGEWRIKVYKVLAEESPYFFNYPGFAGLEIQAPFPLRQLPICPETAYISGPGWKAAVEATFITRPLPRSIMSGNINPVR